MKILGRKKFPSSVFKLIKTINPQSSLIYSFELNKSINRSSIRSLHSNPQDYLQTKLENNKFFIKFNRPQKRNCLNFESIERLKGLLKKIDQNEQIEAIVLHGEGDNFCSGFDLNELRPENKQRLINLLYDENWFKSDKLLISYVRGYAVGLGFELALESDIIIADESSRFGFLNRRFGLPSFLPLRRYRNLVGRLKAIDLLDNPKLIDSKEASNLGLIKYLIHKEIPSLNSILDSIEIDKDQLIKERNTLNTDLKLIKSTTDLPEEWLNHHLNSMNYNLNRKNRHGKFDLSFWKDINSS